MAPGSRGLRMITRDSKWEQFNAQQMLCCEFWRRREPCDQHVRVVLIGQLVGKWGSQSYSCWEELCRYVSKDPYNLSSMHFHFDLLLQPQEIILIQLYRNFRSFLSEACSLILSYGVSFTCDIFTDLVNLLK